MLSFFARFRVAATECGCDCRPNHTRRYVSLSQTRSISQTLPFCLEISSLRSGTSSHWHPLDQQASSALRLVEHTRLLSRAVSGQRSEDAGAGVGGMGSAIVYLRRCRVGPGSGSEDHRFASSVSPSPRHRAGTQTDGKIGNGISLHYARVQEHAWRIRGMSRSRLLYQSSVGEHP